MKLIEISPEIVQLTRFGLVNCYLVRENDGLTLVDTMVGGSATQIYTAANGLNRPLRRIQSVGCRVNLSSGAPYHRVYQCQPVIFADQVTIDQTKAGELNNFRANF